MTYATVISRGEYRSLHAATLLAPGTTIFSIEGDECSQPSRHSVQVGPDVHIVPRRPGDIDSLSIWQFMNHSCEPNVSVDTSAREFRARRTILAGEELTFNYNTTEWNMAEPFDCNCGAPSCAGVVSGFCHLSPAIQVLMLPECAHHIKLMYGAVAGCPAPA